jgi:hypothetical protein
MGTPGKIMRLAILGAAFACASSICFAAESSETLIVPPYPAQTPWKQIMDQRTPAMRWMEWIPADQTENDISDILTQQDIYALKEKTPSLFIVELFRALKSACEGLATTDLIERTESGYPVAYGKAYCTNQKGAAKDVDISLKVIAGKTALHVVQREFRRPALPGAIPGERSFPPDQREAAKATIVARFTADVYLTQVRLCPSAEPCAMPTSWPVYGKTHQSEVRERVGMPSTATPSPDGRHVDVYKGADGLFRAYLYDKDKMLVRLRVLEAPEQ